MTFSNNVVLTVSKVKTQSFLPQICIGPEGLHVYYSPTKLAPWSLLHGG